MSAPAAAKKGKKKGKAKTVSLNDFLGDAQGPGIVKKLDWADEADEDFRSVNSSLTYQSSTYQSSTYQSTSAPKVIQLPTAPRAARSVEIDRSRIPETGPFTAFVGNLPYEADEQLIQEFFKDLPIVNVRLPIENGRFKGFGYVQFNDKQSLIKALEMNEETLQKRNIRIDVADNQNKDSGGSNWRQGGDRRESGPDPTEGNWRQAAADETARQAAEYQDKRDASCGGNALWEQRHRSRDHGERYDPDRQHAGYSRRQHYDYKGSYRNDSYESGGYRKSSQSYDQYDRRYNDRSGYGSRGYNDRSGYDRDSFSRGGFSRQRSDDSFGSRRDEPPRERPQLNLKPRQKPLEDDTAVTSRSSSIFGAAKPVDTAAKEREIEEKLYNKQRSVEEPPAPEKKSSNIFGGAKPIDTSAREREIEKKISEQKERLLSASKAPTPEPPPARSSVFGDAKPVDTAARELEIEEKIRKREQEYSSASRDERSSGRHSRISSERSDDLAPSSPRRRSRTSSARSSEEHSEPALSQKSSESEIRKPEFKPAPIPKQSAWVRKPLAMDNPTPSQEEVSGPGLEDPSSSSTAWNRGPPKSKTGVREEAEGDSKEDEEEARRPEGASNEDNSLQNRNEPGDGSEEGKPSSTSYRPYRPKSDANYNSYQSRRDPDQGRYGGGRQTSDRSRNYDANPSYRDNRNDAYRGNRSDGYRDNRRSGDGDSHTSRNNRGYADDRGSSRSQPDSGSRPKNRNDWSEKKRDSSRDSRPECDRSDAAGQEQSSSSTRPSKQRTKQMPTLEAEAPVHFATESKFALLAMEDSDQD